MNNYTMWLRRLLTVLTIIVFAAASYGIAHAKCDPTKNANCPTEAPGQQIDTDSDSAVVNNGGQTLPDKAVANGVTGQQVDTTSLVIINNGGQVVNGAGNGVVGQAVTGSSDAVLLEADTSTLTLTAPYVITVTETDTKPTGADCSSMQGVVLDPPTETITAQQLHDMLNWDWKDGPTGGRNRIRATNVCVSNGGHGTWSNNLPEPANSMDDIASWKKLARWAELYNQGKLVIILP